MNSFDPINFENLDEMNTFLKKKYQLSKSTYNRKKMHIL